MPTTADTPKCYAEVHGRRLLDHALSAFAGAGVTEICFIGGYQIEKVAGPEGKREMTRARKPL